jgi:hypothetical protein
MEGVGDIREDREDTAVLVDERDLKGVVVFTLRATISSCRCGSGAPKAAAANKNVTSLIYLYTIIFL